MTSTCPAPTHKIKKSQMLPRYFLRIDKISFPDEKVFISLCMFDIKITVKFGLAHDISGHFRRAFKIVTIR